jgi:DNA-binding transcriptional MocR family regulator
MPEEALRRSLRTLARAPEAILTDYGTSLGLPALRQLLVRRMSERGMEASAEQVMLMESGTQAIDLLCRCRLPDGIDATEVAHRALANNVVLAPGNAFSVSQTASSFLRFNVAQCEDERISPESGDAPVAAHFTCRLSNLRANVR